MTYAEVDGDPFVISQDADENVAEIADSAENSNTHYVILDVKKTQAVRLTLQTRDYLTSSS